MFSKFVNFVLIYLKIGDTLIGPTLCIIHKQCTNQNNLTRVSITNKNQYKAK